MGEPVSMELMVSAVNALVHGLDLTVRLPSKVLPAFLRPQILLRNITLH